MRLGIVGSGGIVHTALEALQLVDTIEIQALYCRPKSEDTGRKLCDQYSIPDLYTNYEDFLENKQVDTVYIGLVNSAHYEYSLKALSAGKNVICEKPLALTGWQSRHLIEEAKKRNLLLFEAIMTRYSPNYQAIQNALAQIGNIKLAEARYCQYSSRYDAYKEGTVLPAFDPALGGGALYDINLYCVQFLAGLFGKPEKTEYQANIGFNGVDTSGILTLDYGPFKAIAVGAKDCDGPSCVFLQGDKGVIEVASQPGRIENITMTLKGEKPVLLDAAALGNPMATEFAAIAQIVDTADHEKANEWIEKSQAAMEILEEGRRSAGIHFPADDEALIYEES